MQFKPVPKLTKAQKLDMLNAAAKRQGINKMFKVANPSKELTVNGGHQGGEFGTLLFGPRCLKVNFQEAYASFPAGGGATMDDYGLRINFGSKAPSGYYMVDIAFQADHGGGGFTMSANTQRTSSGGNDPKTYSTAYGYSSGHFVFVMNTHESSGYRIDIHSDVPFRFTSAEISRVE